MNQIVWLSAGAWQKPRFASVTCLPRLSLPPPRRAGLVCLLWALGEDLELSHRRYRPQSQGVPAEGGTGP